MLFQVKSQSVGGPGTGMARAGGGGGGFTKITSANGAAVVDGAAIPLLAMGSSTMSANAGTQTMLIGGGSINSSEYYAASSSSSSFGAASGLITGSAPSFGGLGPWNW